ncbi:MAG: prepilin-type N-terminal cleavage/methylation domain-containing protein [Opitutaceae bacterium]|jgi:prepilin-type N-terminal cleavage/methylation domain-containing protein/prepilin-type processing-associated H-X9-DG protein|nr:prepilin-type N-terminal cleavage/methylation domain-containing protein [Opitutaceae bacterium]
MKPAPVMSPAVRIRRAFTLIELLTVIAIIGILAAIIIPTVGKVRESAKNARCVSNLRQCGSALMIFATENKNRIPVASAQNEGEAGMWTRILTDWKSATDAGTRSYDGIFFCPSLAAEPQPYTLNATTGFGSGVYRTYGMLHGGLQIDGNEVDATNGGWLDKRDRANGGACHYLDRVPAPSRIPLVLDTVTYSGSANEVGRQLYYFYSNKTNENATIHLRHGNKANTLFYDGHVKAMSAQDFANLGFTTPVVPTSAISDPVSLPSPTT